jgi:hypothetical protein
VDFCIRSLTAKERLYKSLRRAPQPIKLSYLGKGENI